MQSLCSHKTDDHWTRLERFYLQGICSPGTHCNTRTRTGLLRRFVHLNLRKNNLLNIKELYRIISDGRKDRVLRHTTTADLVAYLGSLLVSVARDPQANTECVQFMLKSKWLIAI